MKVENCVKIAHFLTHLKFSGSIVQISEYIYQVSLIHNI